MNALRTLEQQCNIRATAHRLCADKYVVHSVGLRIPVIVLSAVITMLAAIFASLDLNAQWTQIVIAAISMCVTSLVGIAEYLKYGENAVKHQAKARIFLSLLEGIKKALIETNPEIIHAKYEKIHDLYTQAINEDGYPRLPVTYELKARTIIMNEIVTSSNRIV